MWKQKQWAEEQGQAFFSGLSCVTAVSGGQRLVLNVTVFDGYEN